MYAIIVTGGKQYRVEQGDIVYIEKLEMCIRDRAVVARIVAAHKI